MAGDSDMRLIGEYPGGSIMFSLDEKGYHVLDLDLTRKFHDINPVV